MATRVDEPCGYGCGKPWIRWQGTKLIGHAACSGSLELQDDVLMIAERFPVPVRRIAADLGVTVGVVGSWLAIARARRRRHRQAMR